MLYLCDNPGQETRWQNVRAKIVAIFTFALSIYSYKQCTLASLASLASIKVKHEPIPHGSGISHLLVSANLVRNVDVIQSLSSLESCTGASVTVVGIALAL